MGQKESGMGRSANISFENAVLPQKHDRQRSFDLKRWETFLKKLKKQDEKKVLGRPWFGALYKKYKQKKGSFGLGDQHEIIHQQKFGHSDYEEKAKFKKSYSEKKLIELFVSNKVQIEAWGTGKANEDGEVDLDFSKLEDGAQTEKDFSDMETVLGTVFKYSNMIVENSHSQFAILSSVLKVITEQNSKQDFIFKVFFKSFLKDYVKVELKNIEKLFEKYEDKAVEQKIASTIDLEKKITALVNNFIQEVKFFFKFLGTFAVEYYCLDQLSFTAVNDMGYRLTIENCPYLWRHVMSDFFILLYYRRYLASDAFDLVQKKMRKVSAMFAKSFVNLEGITSKKINIPVELFPDYSILNKYLNCDPNEIPNSRARLSDGRISGDNYKLQLKSEFRDESNNNNKDNQNIHDNDSFHNWAVQERTEDHEHNRHEDDSEMKNTQKDSGPDDFANDEASTKKNTKDDTDRLELELEIPQDQNRTENQSDLNTAYREFDKTSEGTFNKPDNEANGNINHEKESEIGLSNLMDVVGAGTLSKNLKLITPKKHLKNKKHKENMMKTSSNTNTVIVERTEDKSKQKMGNVYSSLAVKSTSLLNSPLKPARHNSNLLFERRSNRLSSMSDKIVSKLEDLTTESQFKMIDLMNKKTKEEPFSKATLMLKNIQLIESPISKLWVFFETLSLAIQEMRDYVSIMSLGKPKKVALTIDNLMSIIIYIVIKAKIVNLKAHFEIIKDLVVSIDIVNMNKLMFLLKGVSKFVEKYAIEPLNESEVLFY